MDDGGNNPGAFPPIAAIDILHHFFAPLMLKIDINIGRLIALFGKEAREQQVVCHRINRSDAQQIADDRIGRRAAPLAQYRRILRAGEFDDVMDSEEIGRIAELADKREFLRQQRAPFGRQAIWVMGMRGLHHHMLQPVLRVPAFGHWLVRIFVAELAKIELHSFKQGLRRGDGFGGVGEKAGHFLRRFQMAFGIDREQSPCFVDARPFADAGENIMQGSGFGRSIKRVIDRD